ncbi:MAG: protoporphyrinogen oxidase [Gemmatimonadetes bacterium]|nr:protoporphyrinogen oxidase [Gemmatimonadota bacterium]MYH19433.1 protoporphyrinogen oxidase [Gemmatimonadota bacterium]MYK97936.1 protoporphyrinogen oxidase [Gemmatimonadota bacterium]
MKVVVVGGGIAGLSAAHRLTESGHPGLEVTLLERSDRFGGTIRTVEREGCLVELGPDSFLTSKPWLSDLAGRLGVADRIIPTARTHRRSHVVHRGKLHPLPDGFLMMAPTRLWPMVGTSLFSWKGKARCALDLVLPRGSATGDESLGAFVRRRFGGEVLKRVVQPLIGGIYAGDPDTLSLKATIPRFFEMEQRHRSVIKAMVAQRRAAAKQQRGASAGSTAAKHRGQASADSGGPAGSGARYGELASFDRGMEIIVQALLQQLPSDAMHTQAEVTRLTRDGSGWNLACGDGRDYHVDGVILAVPSRHAAELLHGTDSGLFEELAAIPHASSAVMNLAYRRSDVPHPLDCFGFVVPAVEGREIIACTFSSVKFPNRAPEGLVLLRVFLGGMLQQELLRSDDEVLLRIVRGELRDLMGIESEPLHTELARYPDAMPQYLVGHGRRVERIESLLGRHPGLALAGNAYGGVGLPDCVRSGEQAAERVLGGTDAARLTEPAS